MEDAAKGAMTALLDQLPSGYLPAVLVAVLFIIILTIVFILMNRHTEKIFDKSIEQIRTAYTDNIKTQNETIRILTKNLAQTKKNNL